MPALKLVLSAIEEKGLSASIAQAAWIVLPAGHPLFPRVRLKLS